MKAINGKLYDVCGTCGKIIRMDKPIFGSLHICLNEEEAELCRTNQQFRDWQVARVRKARDILSKV